MSFGFKDIFKLITNDAMSMFDKMITADTAEHTIDVLDQIENHALLKDDNAYVIQKYEGKIKLIHAKGSQISFDKEPMIIDLSDVLDGIREKAEDELEKVGYYEED